MSRASQWNAGGAEVRVSETEEIENQNRQELKTKRQRLYKLFSENPMHTRLAVEIKALDDQLAASSEQTKSANVS